MSWLVRIAGIGLIAAFALLTFAAMMDWPLEAEVDQTAAPRASATFAPLPAVNAAARQSILDRSPFIQGRSPFNRETAMAPPPVVDARLTGILKMGKDLRANLLIGGQAIMVKKGDDTPIGKVVAIEGAAVVIEGAATLRLELFKQ